jgi:hypothetical protein
MKLKPAAQAFKIKKYRKPSEALKKALDILTRPGRWITGELAVSFDDGDPEKDCVQCSTKAEKKTAMAFCALGAVRFVNGPAQKSAEGFLREAGKQIRYEKKYDQKYIDNIKADENNIFHVNDWMGFDATIEMFKLAIKNARAAGK